MKFDRCDAGAVDPNVSLAGRTHHEQALEGRLELEHVPEASAGKLDENWILGWRKSRLTHGAS
jgi:hypothetical protein